MFRAKLNIAGLLIPALEAWDANPEHLESKKIPALKPGTLNVILDMKYPF